VALKEFQCPDTIDAAWIYPGEYMVSYHGTLSGSLDGGNLVFRGSKATLKLNRDGFSVYPEGVVPFEKTAYPDPIISARSTEDGTVAHMRNFLDCVRSRKAPNAPITAAIAAARSAHLGNASLRRNARIQLR
jgi:hypothetical protein